MSRWLSEVSLYHWEVDKRVESVELDGVRIAYRQTASVGGTESGVPVVRTHRSGRSSADRSALTANWEGHSDSAVRVLALLLESGFGRPWHQQVEIAFGVEAMLPLLVENAQQAVVRRATHCVRPARCVDRSRARVH